jgi:glycosyltransferase involved in cell wall biosynthesis
MIYVSVTYDYVPGYNTTESWFYRSRAYTGILEHLGKKETVIDVIRIDFEGTYIHQQVEHRFVDFSKKKTHFPLKLNRLVKTLNPEIILLQGLHNPVQFLQLRLLAKKGVKVIAHHHAEKPFTGIRKTLQQLADRYIDAYLFASRDLGAEWVNNGNIASPDKIHELMEVSSVFYPMDKELAKKKTTVTGALNFLWVGRLNANKDPLNVVNAFLKFAAINPSATLYMIYQTTELLAAILEILKSHPQKKSIVLVGEVNNDDLLYWYNSTDFLVSGSHYEGSGTVVSEAISCGCIPVVTDIPSFRMITDNGACGILYEAGNEAALLSALLATAQLNKEQKRQVCLDYFKAKLSFDAIAGRIREVAASL